MSPWHAMAPMFLSVNLNSRSPLGCWSYQVRVTSSSQGSALVAPEGETPTKYEASSGLALFQVQLFDAPAAIPPVAHVLNRVVPSTRMFAPQLIAPVFWMVKWNSRSPPYFWTSQVRATEILQELEVLAPIGERPT